MLAALQHILASLGLHANPEQFAVLFGLIFARISIAIGLTPFLGGKSVFGRMKVGLAVVISALLFESVAPGYPSSLTTISVICLLAKELMIGATLGFLSQIVFHSIQMAGAMVDYG